MADVSAVSVDEQRRRDFQSALAKASPMALPGLLMRAEVQDREDALAVFDKAVKEFGEGGVQTQFLDTAMRGGVNGVYIALAGAFGEKHKGAQHLGLESQSFYDDVVKFRYPDGRDFSKTDADDEMQYQMGAVVRDDMSVYHRDRRLQELYDRLKEKREAALHKANIRSPKDLARYSKVIRCQIEDKKRMDAREEEIRNDGRRTRDEFGKELDKNKNGFERDHIKPLKSVHEDFSGFADRYADGYKTLKEVANDPSNLDAADSGLNKSKNDKTNDEYIPDIGRADAKVEMTDKEQKYCEGLSRKQRDRYMRMTSDEREIYSKMTPKQRETFDRMTPKQQEEFRRKGRQAENEIRLKLGKEGAKTVSNEQIGRLVILLMGPVYFEFKEWYATQKRDPNALSLGGRLKRMGNYVIHELPRILKEFAMDMGQMLTQLFKSLIVKFVTGLFSTMKQLLKKLVGAVVDGFRTIVSAVKILCDKRMSAAQKGDAVMKLLATFVVSVLGKLAMDLLMELVKQYVPVPDWLASLITAFSTTILTALVLYGLDKLDLFAVKSEMRLRRITEIFEERRRVREERLRAFNVAATEALRRQEEEWAKIKGAMDDALENRDMDAMNGALDGVARLFNVDIPYATPAEFVRYIRANPRIQIA